MKALEIKGLKKTFRSNFLIKKYRILKGIDIEAEKGEIYGFLGSNGAGKTTTIKCVLGLLFPDQVEILIDGKPAAGAGARQKNQSHEKNGGHSTKKGERQENQDGE